MDKIIIPLNDTPASEIEKLDGVITAISWDSLLPVINQMVRLRPDEIIDGLVINDTDIRVKISRKRGRKTKA
ncbi:MAG: hypothetical protein JWO92_2503 [Chitinophagaceae bacterium]|nr:hypothetical protein [Chitinophagaceae bacterium]